MRSQFINFPVALLLSAWVFPAFADDNLPTPAQIAAWRAEGPPALERLVRGWENGQYTDKSYSFGLLNTDKPGESPLPKPKRTGRWDAVFDQVDGAKYSHLSELYWYTDEALAKAAAQREKKPILTLRLLGNLTDELSCANSRFFRQLLYPHPEIRSLLHDKFILHWKSLRPVPTITVDMHNGCKIEQSITGNSVHYVVLPEGQIVDVIPGLYGPVLFHKRLQTAHAAAQTAMSMKDPAPSLQSYRDEQLAQIQNLWKQDSTRYQEVERIRQIAIFSKQGVGMPPAQPLPFWETLGGFHPEFAQLDKDTIERIRTEAWNINVVQFSAPPQASAARPRQPSRNDLDYAFRKGTNEAPFFKEMLACLYRDLAADTVKNEYSARYRALQQLGAEPQSLAIFNEWVYAKLFGYEIDKPWAGMESAVQYAALPDHDGGFKHNQKIFDLLP